MRTFEYQFGEVVEGNGVPDYGAAETVTVEAADHVDAHRAVERILAGKAAGGGLNLGAGAPRSIDVRVRERRPGVRSWIGAEYRRYKFRGPDDYEVVEDGWAAA